MIASPPASPDAISTTMSLVEVSESTEMRLNVRSVANRRAALQASEVSGASVVMTPSIVAMLGAIMPLPFAMPPTVTVRPSSSNETATSLAKVSVVMMAAAASDAPDGASAATAPGIAETMSSTGSGTPMTPVEETMTSCGSQRERLADDLRGQNRRAFSWSAGAGVRVAGVDDHGARDSRTRCAAETPVRARRPPCWW